MEGGMTCVKYLLFAFNLLFCIFGITLMGIGIYVQIQLRDYLDFFNSDINGPAILLIIVGFITLAIAFLGCCGAIKENHCMTLTFAVLIGLIFVCEMGAGIAGFVLKGKVDTFVKDELKDSMRKYNKTGFEGVTHSWNWLQKQSHCCGVDSWKDWTSTNNTALPKSCCDDGVKECMSPTNRPGCLPATENLLRDNIGYFAGAAIGLAVVEISGIFIACMLARAIKAEYDVV